VVVGAVGGTTNRRNDHIITVDGTRAEQAVLFLAGMEPHHVERSPSNECAAMETAVAKVKQGFSPTTVRRMVVGSVSDPAEQEADAMADAVLAAMAASGPASSTQRVGDTGSKIRRSASAAVVGASGGELDDATSRDIRRARGGGRPMEPGVRRSMESAFSADFSDVRLHVGAQSDDLNNRIQARAFTAGNDVFVRRRDYAPNTTSGQHLLAHELAHTVQQGSSRIRRFSDGTTLRSNVHGATPADPPIRRLMSEGDFKKKSGGKLSGKRKRILNVDKALHDVSGAMSVSVALDNVINQCNAYLSGPGSKDSTRVKGVKLLLQQAIADLAAWRIRARIPLPDFVFRSDTRDPAIIAKDGFQPWNSAGTISIVEHVKGSLEAARADIGDQSGAVGALAKHHSQFVSTAADIEFAKDPVLVAGLRSKIFYKIATAQNPATFTDVGEHFDGQNLPNPFEKQLEFVQLGGIPGDHVVEYVDGKDIEEFALGLADAASIPWKPMPAPN